MNNTPPFYIGQKLVCTNRTNEWFLDSVQVPGPKRNDVVTCIGCFYRIDCGWGINLKEYPEADEDNYFDVIDSEDHTVLFKPLQEQKMKMITYSKVLEEVGVCEN